MNQKEKILQIAKKHHGVIYTSQVNEAEIGRWALQALEEEGKLYSVQRGVYVTDEGYVDDFFLLQKKFPTGVFSHETALYLHGFSDRAPNNYTMTFPKGTSTTRMKNQRVKPVVTSIKIDLGIETLQRTSEESIKIYNIERTLVDLVRPRYHADLEQLLPAFKRYVASEKKDINKLFEYATVFGVEGKIRTYMGVLL